MVLKKDPSTEFLLILILNLTRARSGISTKKGQIYGSSRFGYRYENLHEMTNKGKKQNSLWTAFIAGEANAFSQLFFDYYELLYHYGYRITPKPALIKDTIQDFFLNLFESRATLSPQVKNIKAYLLTSFRRKLLLELQQQRKLSDTLEQAAQEWDNHFELGIEDVLIKQESRELNKKVVEQLLSELPPRQREIIYLRYYLDLSLPEIADTLDISYQVVANHLYRAVRKLQGSHTAKKFFKLDIWFLLTICSLLEGL